MCCRVLIGLYYHLDLFISRASSHGGSATVQTYSSRNPVPYGNQARVGGEEGEAVKTEWGGGWSEREDGVKGRME